MLLLLLINYLLKPCIYYYLQIDALKQELEKFFGKNPLASKDMSRIVGKPQFERLLKLLNEEGVADKIVLGGQSDEEQL